MIRSNCASAYAMRPSSETVSSLNGSPTLSMPASSSVGLNSAVCSFAIASSIAAVRPHQHDKKDDDADPAEDDPPRMRGAGSRPARERPGRESFVRRAPFQRGSLGHLFSPSLSLLSLQRPDSLEPGNSSIVG